MSKINICRDNRDPLCCPAVRMFIRPFVLLFALICFFSPRVHASPWAIGEVTIAGANPSQVEIDASNVVVSPAAHESVRKPLSSTRP